MTASPMVSIYRVDGFLDELGRIVNNRALDAGRKARRQLIHGRDDIFRRRQRVRTRPLEDGQSHGGIAVEIGIRRIVLGGKLDARHVLEPDHSPRRLLYHDTGEFLGIGEAPQRLHRELEGALLRHRRLVQHAARDLDVLRLQREHDVARGQADGLQPVGIEPHAHRIVAAAKHRDRPDAVDARQRVGNRERGVVRNEQAVARFVRRIEVHDHHQVGRALGHRYADVAHVDRKSRLRDRHAILHLHLGDVEIGAEIERDRDGKAPVRRRVRRHVDHVLDAVDLLLDRRHHGRGDHLRTGPRILSRHVDDGRCDLRILGNREPGERDAADDHEDDRNDRCENRTVDEKMRNPHRPVSLLNWSWLEGRRPAGASPDPRVSPFVRDAPASGH